MIKFHWKTFLLLFLLCSSHLSYGQNVEQKNLDQTISNAIAKAYDAVVRIWGIDSLTGKQNSAQFTGVVVNQEGVILTAAHAIRTGLHYKVMFTNGKEVTAKGLGRMAYEPKTGRPDVAIIRILDKEGNWPTAEMGWSYDLKKDEPCISIAYPTTLNQKFPTIRVGKIADPLTQWEFIQSTCRMEPGDSGGPLFDYMGRVIGIHSRIDISEQINYEVPIDLYRKYWSALLVAKDYRELPATVDQFEKDPKEKSIQTLANFSPRFEEKNQLEALKNNILRIQSKLKGQELHVLATIFKIDTKTAGKYRNSFLAVSKSSLVGDSISAYLNEKKIDVAVLSRDKENDLVLLQLKSNPKSGISLKSILPASSMERRDLGKTLVSILPQEKKEISALSSGIFDIEKKVSTGYFGATANFVNEKIVLSRLNPRSPADIAGLAIGDQIKSVNGNPLKTPPDYAREIMKYEPGDTIRIEAIRKDSIINFPVILRMIPPTSGHPAYHFAGGRSGRADGFKNIFAHDAVLRPEECGGPVFDSNGIFYGINIARFSRTATFVCSNAIIYSFIENGITKH
ncbi:trypsin-like peptidase domain-containing protein [Pedobacter sp. MW01-1-1]|uniref:trypsin-like peptidase domain-containing protein n=1 Tax=Pedobacter sp. MW01-1-1 TaxID=3383027 RepID=UPI003FED7981